VLPPLTPRTRKLLAFASGLVFAATSPPINITVCVILGLVLFAIAVGETETVRPPSPRVFESPSPRVPEPPSPRVPESPRRWLLRGMGHGFLFGLGANLLALRFVPDVIARFTPLPWVAGLLALVLLSAMQAVPWMIAGGVARVLEVRLRAPRWLAFGCAIYGATFVPAIFPWTPAGGLTRWPMLVQTAEIVGERGTSFLVAIACGLVAEAVRRGAMRGEGRVLAGIALGIFVVLAGHGALRMHQVEGARASAPHAKVALLQPDFDAFDRWEESRAVMMMDRLTKLTRRAEDTGATLTVWPESAYPYTLAHGIRTSPRGNRAVLQGGVKGPVLTGAFLTKGGGIGTNATFLATSDGSISPSYDKRHLLWFGETVPGATLFPWLRKTFARGTGIMPGTEQVAFEAGPIVAAVLNCYEDTLPEAGREAMSVRPNLLVNVTNDAWFAGSAEGELHLRLAVLRAIEARRDLVRSVNRGPTTWVSATGEILARREALPGLGPPPPLVVDAALLDGPPTLFTSYGDAPLALLVALALLANHRRTARPS
jgi:apolipoprotein N-acyltransferase